MVLAKTEYCSTKDPDINPNTYGYLNFNKENMNVHCLKKNCIFKNVPALTGWLHEEKSKLTHTYHLSQTTT